MNTINLTKCIQGLSLESSDKSFVFDYQNQSFSWSAETEREYNRISNKIDSIKTKRKNWELYCWYDVSGFDYWVNKQEEPNYIAITIRVNADKITKTEARAIERTLNRAIKEADEIQMRYSPYYSAS